MCCRQPTLLRSARLIPHPSPGISTSSPHRTAPHLIAHRIASYGSRRLTGQSRHFPPNLPESRFLSLQRATANSIQLKPNPTASRSHRESRLSLSPAGFRKQSSGVKKKNKTEGKQLLPTFAPSANISRVALSRQAFLS